MKNIGIIGLGSIGSRHAKMLHDIGVTNIRALRSKKGEIKEKSDQLKFVQEYTDESEFYHNLDGVIISNPTSLHVEKAAKSLERGIPTFIEKPIGHDIASVNPLKKYKNNLIVGYCFRFSGFVQAIRKFIDEDKLGKIFKVSFTRSFYLPKWHPYADYRKEYTARKELGGGVLRTLSHEIDLMLYFFGYPKSTIGFADKVSDLEIDTDDLAFFSCKMETGSRVNFELDFLSPDYIGRGIIIGEKGKLEYDMKTLNFIPYNGESSCIYEFGSNEWDEMYINQMKDFLQFINIGKSQNCSFDDAIETMRIIEEVETL